MEDNFKIIYRILRTLERAMDADVFDFESVRWEALGISKPRWEKIMEMLIEDGLIKGCSASRDMAGYVYINGTQPRITLKGLEFLSENTLMKRAVGGLKTAKGIIPGI